MSATPKTPETQIPAWWNEYRTSFLAGEAHAFVLTGDIAGYAYEGTSQRRFLLNTLGQTRNVVAIYHRASGISFVSDSMREKAMMLLGQGGKSAAPKDDPLTAALGNLAPKSSGPVDPFSQARQPSAALAVLEQLLTTDAGKEQVAVIIDLADLVVPPFAKNTASPDNLNILAQILNWATAPAIARRNNPIFLLTTRLTDIHDDIRASGSGWKAIEIAMPDYAARLAYVQWRLAQAKKPIPLNDLSIEELARLTAGLNLHHIEDILLLAVRAGGVTRALVRARKDAIITSEYSEVAEMIEPLREGFVAIGGADHLIEWAKDEIIAPVRDGRPDDAPKGVLLVGPPGTGKTFFVKSLATEVGYNAVALNLSNILGGIVGESERRLQRFFAFARSLAPVLVFVDEIDQSDVSRRGNGSGNPVAANLFNQMLQFMSDESLRGRVIVIFASNRPDLIDPALLRFGRMDAIIPVLLPDEEARAGIVRAQARTQGATIQPDAVATLAGATDNFSAADLAAVVSKARKLARRVQAAAITSAHVQQALQFIRPATITEAQKYTLLAVSACNDGEYLPAKYAAMLADRAELQTQIRDADPDAAYVRSERTL